jgi:IclR family KDG regulon transcriptional repressor
MSASQPVQSVDRAITLLEVLSGAQPRMSLADVSKAAHLPKSTTHRLLQTLVQRGLVRQDGDTAEYALGLKLFEMAFIILNRMDLRKQALPVLERLNEETNLTVHLAILDEGDVVYIEKMDPERPVRMYSAVGKRAPAHSTGLGKTLLAYLPEEELRCVVEEKGLPRYTPNTITTWGGLVDELAMVRRRGYALDAGEHEEVLRCVAAPVRDAHGEVIAAVSLTGTVSDMNIEEAERLASLVVRRCDEISRRMGYGGLPSAPSEHTA